MKHDVVTYKLHTKLENVGKVRTFWGGRKVVRGGEIYCMRVWTAVMG